MIYKTELHAHCKEISQCAKVSSEYLTEIYEKFGYSSLVLTNHFERYTMSKTGAADYRDFVRIYCDAYDAMAEKARGRLSVLLGAEIRFDENINDYLLYGVTREKLLALEGCWEMGVQKFHEAIASMDMLLVQAHPFRHQMTVTKADYIDGIEIFNGHPGHNSNNDMAQLWARKYGKTGTSGSDFHETEQIPTAGILTEEKLSSNEQLLQALKEKKLHLITEL